MPEERCVKCGNKAPWFSFWGNLFITVFKLAVGSLGGSHALIADGFHSFTDVIGTGAIIGTRRISRKPSDDCHPYGHGKAEYLGSIFIYTVLLFLSSAIFAGGLFIILEWDLGKPSLVTVLAAAVSVLCNYVMYLLGQCAGRRNHSPALIANSFENRADAISSLAVIFGIGAAIYIHPVFDPIAAMIVGLIIFWNCVTQLNESFSGLMDKALPPEAVGRIGQVAMAHKGVVGVDFVKTRQTGTKFWVDLGIQLPGDINVSLSDRIASEVRNTLMRRYQRFQNVEVYVSSAPMKPPKRRSFTRNKKQSDG